LISKLIINYRKIDLKMNLIKKPVFKLISKHTFSY